MLPWPGDSARWASGTYRSSSAAKDTAFDLGSVLFLQKLVRSRNSPDSYRKDTARIASLVLHFAAVSTWMRSDTFPHNSSHGSADRTSNTPPTPQNPHTCSTGIGRSLAAVGALFRCWPTFFIAHWSRSKCSLRCNLCARRFEAFLDGRTDQQSHHLLSCTGSMVEVACSMLFVAHRLTPSCATIARWLWLACETSSLLYRPSPHWVHGPTSRKYRVEAQP